MNKYLLIIVTLCCSCTWDQPEPKVPVNEVAPSSCIPDTVKFSEHVQPVFRYNCVGTYCHSGTNPPGHVNLEEGTSYEAIISEGYVDVNNPKQSLLYSRMISTSNPMPPYGNLDKCKTDLILKWIEQGGLDN